MTKASDNPFPSTLFEEQSSAPTTPAAGFWRLYLKSDGLYIVDDAGVETGPFAVSAGAAAIVQLADTTLGAPAANFDFTSISGSYKHLLITGVLRSDRSGSAADGVYIRFNNDSGANYHAIRNQFNNGTTVISSEGVATATPTLSFLIPGATAPANFAGPIRIEIPNYAGTTFAKSALAQTHGVAVAASGSIYNSLGSVTWNNTAAITRVTIAPLNGPNFIAGSRLTLYGLN